MGETVEKSGFVEQLGYQKIQEKHDYDSADIVASNAGIKLHHVDGSDDPERRLRAACDA